MSLGANGGLIGLSNSQYKKKVPICRYSASNIFPPVYDQPRVLRAPTVAAFDVIERHKRPWRHRRDAIPAPQINKRIAEVAVFGSL
jgi:hypothetical protein